MKVEKILFPTDFSEGAHHALPYAVDLAKHYNAKLYILHIVHDVFKATDSHIPHVSSDELYREMSLWAEKEIDTCCLEEVRELPDVEKTVVRGVPYEEIVNFAEKEKIDMIVIGTHGRVGLERFIFGSTAERVVRRAPCPVMSVRVPEHRGD
ncbi:MAG TPA: universal stress protein [Nitrospirae bacterium]|nr:putative universal stress protein [bacterium BMS3Abin10]GBE39659.1 putative universal stress protein [bacterium BMS3Bbin08]HDH49785.1 universal stress protein [Nitrospirota bacterium]HDK17531.1 universal stress protein [Nitrospirota bacterium]HDK82070.1 universal stress protein [Nitrospirota bacterium]